MITFTDDQIARIMDRLNNGRQMVQCARVLPQRCDELIDEARRVLTECAKALEAGQVVPDGPHAEPWAKDDYETAMREMDERYQRREARKETDSEWAARVQHVPTIDETAKRIMVNDAKRGYDSGNPYSRYYTEDDGR